MNPLSDLSKDISEALASDREYELSWEVARFLWPDEKFHRDERLLLIHQLAGQCNGCATIGPTIVRFKPAHRTYTGFERVERILREASLASSADSATDGDAPSK